MNYIREIENGKPISCEYGYFLTTNVLSIDERQDNLWNLESDDTSIDIIRSVLYDYYFDLLIMKKHALICRENLRYK